MTRRRGRPLRTDEPTVPIAFRIKASCYDAAVSIGLRKSLDANEVLRRCLEEQFRIDKLSNADA